MDVYADPARRFIIEFERRDEREQLYDWMKENGFLKQSDLEQVSDRRMQDLYYEDFFKNDIVTIYPADEVEPTIEVRIKDPMMAIIFKSRWQ